jgi:hypothetical protein
MAVQTAASAFAYTGNNSTVTVYPFPAPYLLPSDIYVHVKVTADEEDEGQILQQGVDYVLTPILNADNMITGGEIITADAWDDTHTVTIFRQVPLTQVTEFPETGPFPARSVELGYDKVVMALQQMHRRILALEGNEDSGSIVVVPEGSAGQDALQDVATFADAAARGNAIPKRVGQLGIQLDTAVMYRSTGTSAGAWTPQDAFSATQRVRGRNTAGAGAAEEVSLTQLLDWIGGAAQGDILYRGASSWARLPAGTAGLPLITKGAGQNPVWEASYEPGTIVRAVRVTDTNGYSTTTATPALDNTIPQIGEGTQFFTTSYTPKLATSTLFLRISGYCTGTTAQNVMLALFVGAGPDAVGATYVTVPSANYGLNFVIACQFANTTADAKTISARFGTNTGTALINSQSGAQTYGLSDGITLEILEVAP